MSATLVRNFREKYRLNQSEMGTLVGRSRSAIAAYEGGTQEVDGAVSGLIRLLNDKRPAEIVAMLSRNTSPTSLPPAEEAVALERFLLEAGESRTIQVEPNNPESDRWRFERGAATQRFHLATLERLGQATIPMGMGGALTGERTRDSLGTLGISSRLSRLGTTFATIDGTLSDFTTAILSDPPAHWISEGEAMPDATVTLAAIAGSYQTVGTSLALSRRLLRQAGPGGLRAFGQAMTRSLARELDRACLNGTGTHPEPMGILSEPLLTSIDAGALTFDGAFWQAIRTLEENGCNSESISVLAHPKTVEKLRALTDISAVIKDWVIELGRQYFRGYPALSTPTCPEGSVLIGDFSQLTVRVASQVELRVLDGLRPDGAHLVYAFLDAAIENPYADKAFVVLENVFTA